jgi:hypothetical protein
VWSFFGQFLSGILVGPSSSSPRRLLSAGFFGPIFLLFLQHFLVAVFLQHFLVAVFLLCLLVAVFLKHRFPRHCSDQVSSTLLLLLHHSAFSYGFVTR